LLLLTFKPATAAAAAYFEAGCGCGGKAYRSLLLAAEAPAHESTSICTEERDNRDPARLSTVGRCGLHSLKRTVWVSHVLQGCVCWGGKRGSEGGGEEHYNLHIARRT